MNISRKFMHMGKIFDWTVTQLPAPTGAAPDVPSFAAPGAGAIAITPIILAPAILPADGKVTLAATVRGENIAHIFIEMLLYDETQGYAYGPVYREYLQAPDHKEVGGVPHPVWGESATVHATFRPTLRALSDGAATAFAFATPEAYVRPPETQAYSIRGQFTTAEDQTTRTARLTFDNAGRMTRIVGFGERSEDDDETADRGAGKKRSMAQSIGAFLGRGAPRTLTPQPGDTFIPEGYALLLPQDANGVWSEGIGTSTPLTFKETPLHWDILPLLPATYLAGVAVEDFDGEFTRKYAPLIILPRRDAIHETTADSETRRHIPDARRPKRL